jgi:predicted DCC family thiol-disulfide oxidoreductase YuxK
MSIKALQLCVRLHQLDNVVIFDGVCNLCAHSVKFILHHEADQTLRFTPLQSPAGARLMSEFGIEPEQMKTFVLIADGKAYVKSDAAIRVSRFFRDPWKLLGAIKVIPRPIRDRAYDLIARNRYRWFGRLDTCMVPTPALRARFIMEHDNAT